MSHRYEVLILTVPEVTQDESKQLETDLDALVVAEKGSVLSFERWGKYKLTYPIRHNDYGVYFLIRFESSKALTKQIDELFRIRLNNFVVRHVVTALEGTSLEYQRPKSLEEAPESRDMDSFLRKNKMQGLLSSVDRRDVADADFDLE
ncbi:MAG: 30S ribosomal protein S6 [uncultured bacterium]|nr:MAG: 30S ribosomal protein S6 [uncultured bacterium]HLE76265.1 30S ribosomal protein S6 [Candidatus Babeliales bacterium]